MSKEQAIEELRRAVLDKGTHPDYHDAQLNRLRVGWPMLHRAIMNAIS